MEGNAEDSANVSDAKIWKNKKKKAKRIKESFASKNYFSVHLLSRKK